MCRTEIRIGGAVPPTTEDDLDDAYRRRRVASTDPRTDRDATQGRFTVTPTDGPLAQGRYHRERQQKHTSLCFGCALSVHIINNLWRINFFPLYSVFVFASPSGQQVPAEVLTQNVNNNNKHRRPLAFLFFSFFLSCTKRQRSYGFRVRMTLTPSST